MRLRDAACAAGAGAMIVCFDIGTTAVKGALFSEDGRMLRRESCGAGTADPGGWFPALFGISTELAAEASLRGGRLQAAVISGNGPTLVPVSADGDFLEPVLGWMDRRAVAQSDQIASVQDFRIDPSFYLPKAMWIRDNLPGVFEKTRCFLSCPESVVYRLTGNAVSMMPGRLFERYYWDDGLLEKTGMPQDKFPPFVAPGTVCGKLTETAAGLSGLPAGLDIIAAGPDFIVSLLGTASVRPGRACDRSGTSEGINLCTEKLIEDGRLMSYGHVVEPWYNLSGIISTTGGAVGWAQNALGGSSDPSAFTSEAAKSVPGAGGLLFLPYLAGERAPLWDPAARGSFIGLTLEHGRPEMIRAVLEGAGFAVRDVLEVMAENGGTADELRVTGAPAANDLWNQIKADISGCRILATESSDPELLGGLALALRTTGVYDNLADAADSVVRIRRVYEPGGRNRQLYDDLFGLYRRAYGGLRDIFPELGRVCDKRQN